MKKTLITIGLTLALVMTAVMPSPVMAAPAAASEKNRCSEPFKAEGQAAVTAGGTITSQRMFGKNIMIIQRSGEVISGQIASSPEWPELTGAVFQIVQNATTSLNFQNHKFNSVATGTVTVVKGEGSYMVGKYRAFMRGEFTGDELSQVVFDYVIDLGHLDLDGVSGLFSGVSVKATAYAKLSLTPISVPPFATLAGPITLKGARS